MVSRSPARGHQKSAHLDRRSARAGQDRSSCRLSTVARRNLPRIPNGILINSHASGQPSVELGEGCGGYPVDQHGGSDDEAADHPRFLDTRLPQGECRRSDRAEPSEEVHVLRSRSKRFEQRSYGQHRRKPPQEEHRHNQERSSPTLIQPPLPRQRHPQVGEIEAILAGHLPPSYA